MKKTQMNKKGITLTSLIIYITIMFVVLAIIMRVTTYYTKNMSDVADTSFEEEFEKFNMYMLQETNKSGNYVADVSEDNNSITFTDGNIIEYRQKETSETGEIYFNEIKICENVDACTFTTTDNEETGKTTITASITINETTKTVQYVITNRLNIAQNTLTERDFILKKINEHGIPIDYQEVEYIESTGTQWINTKVIPKVDLNGEFILLALDKGGYPLGSTNGQNNDYWGINLYNGNKTFECYFGTGSYPKVSNWEENVKYTIKIENKKFYCDNDLIYDFSNSSNTYSFNTTNPIYLFGLNYNNGAFRKYRFYSAIFWDEQQMLRKYVPCYSITTVTDVNGKECPKDTIGMYDLVNDEFYTNQGTGEFIAGPEVD